METVFDMSNNNAQPPSIIHNGEEHQDLIVTCVYKRRFWMLFLASCVNMLVGMMFPQYVSNADITSCYYGVTQQAVNWTTMICMVVYIVLVFPMSSLISRIGLRWTTICAALFNTAASAVQFMIVRPDRFLYVMISCFLAAISDVFILGVPPFLAAKWFPSNELSRACSFGVFGNQLGVALGFVFSPMMMSSNCSDKDLIAEGKRNIAVIQTAVNAVILFLIIFTFQDAPKIPPSLSEVRKMGVMTESHMKVIMGMMKNFNFLAVFVMYGLMVGSYFALSTILNNLILDYFPNKERDIGLMGLLFILSGLVGSIIGGYMLDKTHRFKEISLGLCIASFLSCILFSGLLLVHKLWLQFVTISIFGFCLTSILPIGFEYGIEVTYPAPESVCACLLNSSTMIFGLILTEVVSIILEKEGALLSNVALVVTFLISCIVTSFITKDYKRSKLNDKVKPNDPTEK